jgi:3'-phosphoadenosine 5'-phosphosulfate sulfotransferase (PAPS reductase)/FAD synthetase
VSGGKDSTATALALVEAGIPHRRVFADTRWEAPETYDHLDMLRAKLGPIDVVGYPGGMPAKIREGARFASRMQRWCTRERRPQRRPERRPERRPKRRPERRPKRRPERRPERRPTSPPHPQ